MYHLISLSFSLSRSLCLSLLSISTSISISVSISPNLLLSDQGYTEGGGLPPVLPVTRGWLSQTPFYSLPLHYEKQPSLLIEHPCPLFRSLYFTDNCFHYECFLHHSYLFLHLSDLFCSWALNFLCSPWSVLRTFICQVKRLVKSRA